MMQIQGYTGTYMNCKLDSDNFGKTHTEACFMQEEKQVLKVHLP